MTDLTPPLVTPSRETLVRFLHNQGDGGIWEHFDRTNAETVADALLASGVVTIKAEFLAGLTDDEAARWDATVKEVSATYRALAASLSDREAQR